MAAPPDPDDTWLHFIQAGYYDEAPGPACLYCNPNPIRTEEGEMEDTGTSSSPSNTGSPSTSRKKEKLKEKSGKECKRFFCIPCKQGGLCVNEFHSEGRPHFGHPRLQIFRTSYENSVRKDDMVDLLDTTAVLAICSNDHTVHHMGTRKASTALANVLHCEGCREKVANAKSYRYREGNARNARVCSIECLLVYRARNQPVNPQVNQPVYEPVNRLVNQPVNFRNGHPRKQGTPARSPQK